MKVPPECPGEQTKEERKKLKGERQAAASAAVEAPAPTSNGSTAPSLTRQDTMNSLSSGYAKTATRSVSSTPRSVPELAGDSVSPFADTPPTAGSSAPRRNRIVAPPPMAYVGASTDDLSSPTGRKRGRMIYPYEARDASEVTITEGKEFEILEPDGKCLSF